MHYDKLPPASGAETYLDAALRRGDMAARNVKGIPDRLVLKKARERDRLRTVRDKIYNDLKKLHDAYPSFDSLSEFTRKIFSLDMDIGSAKQALGGIHHAYRTINGLVREHVEMIGKVHDEKSVVKIRRACLGRVASVLRGTERHFKVLNEARAVFRRLPVVDDTLFTVAIAGFPNVGKSTLLAKITTASPEVKSYAFTTKGLNVGYFEYMYNRIQFIDTPGTLDREEMNAIEQKAEIALKYLADAIIYVFDPTEGSYPLEDQRKLFSRIQDLDKDLLVYVSKTDIASKEQIEKLDVKAHKDEESLKKEIIELFREWV